MESAATPSLLLQISSAVSCTGSRYIIGFALFALLKVWCSNVQALLRLMGVLELVQYDP